jgi:hypothetical protein
MNEEGLGFCSIPFCFKRFKFSDILGSWNLKKQKKLAGLIFTL